VGVEQYAPWIALGGAFGVIAYLLYEMFKPRPLPPLPYPTPEVRTPETRTVEVPTQAQTVLPVYSTQTVEELPQTYTLYCYIRDEEGKPLAAEVTLNGLTKIADENGMVIFDCEPEKIYTVSASLSGYRTATRSIKVKEDFQTVELTLKPLRPTFTWEASIGSKILIRGVLSGPEGEPVRNATVEAVIVTPEGEEIEPHPQVVTDERGRFRMEVDAPVGGEYRVSLQYPGDEYLPARSDEKTLTVPTAPPRKQVRIAEGQVSINPPNQIIASVRLSVDQRPYPGQVVFRCNSMEQSVTADASGLAVASFTGQPGVSYTVTAEVPGTDEVVGAGPVEVGEVEIPVVKKRMVLQVSITYHSRKVTVSGVVRDSEGKVLPDRVVDVRCGDLREQAMTDESGGFEVEFTLEPGLYAVSIQVGGDAEYEGVTVREQIRVKGEPEFRDVTVTFEPVGDRFLLHLTGKVDCQGKPVGYAQAEILYIEPKLTETYSWAVSGGEIKFIHEVSPETPVYICLTVKDPNYEVRAIEVRTTSPRRGEKKMIGVPPPVYVPPLF